MNRSRKNQTNTTPFSPKLYSLHSSGLEIITFIINLLDQLPKWKLVLLSLEQIIEEVQIESWKLPEAPNLFIFYLWSE